MINNLPKIQNTQSQYRQLNLRSMTGSNLKPIILQSTIDRQL